MSEHSYPVSIVALRELRPAEDLSLLSAREARRLFEIETLPPSGKTEAAPINEPYLPISAPMLLEPAADVRPDTGLEPIPPSRTDEFGPARAVEVVRDAPVEKPAEPSVPRRDWLLQPEPQVVPEAPPNGDDPVRVRELLQWFADGRAATSIIQAPRAAGDLVDVAADMAERPHQVRSLRSGQRLA